MVMTACAAALVATRVTPRQPRRRRRFPYPLVVAALLLGCAAYAGLLARDVWSATREGQVALARGLAALTVRNPADLRPRRLAQAAGDFRRAEGLFARAEARLGSWGHLATTYGGALPGPAGQVQALVPLLDCAGQTAGAAAALGDGLQPVAALLQAPGVDKATTQAGAAGGLVRLTAALDRAQPALARAQRRLAAARAARRRLAGLPVPAAAAPLLAAFDQRAPVLDQALTLARRLPAALGAAGPRSYLLVYQDVADLRATGGYIGSAALVTLDHGRLFQLDYEDSKQLQVPAAHSIPSPSPLFYYEGYGSLELRDANYWPDFPTSARHMAAIYHTITGRRIDGVVAVQPSAVSDLLRALGPLPVPGFHETVTAANVVDRMEYYTHDGPGVGRDPHRKRFVVALSHATLGALLRPGGARLGALAPAVVRALTDRSVLVSVVDPVIGASLREAHWDGALRADRGDYLGVFDQNVTDSKVNPFVGQWIDYSVRRRGDGGLACRVTVTYRNWTPRMTQWIGRTYYQNYVRVAVPAGAVLGEQSGYDDAFWPGDDEAGRQLIAGYVRVPAGATRRVTLAYTLPPSVLSGAPGYRLVVQKQAGSRAAHVTVRVNDGGKTWIGATMLSGDTSFSTTWSARAGTLSVRSAAMPAQLRQSLG